jgi:hypothetical protein
MATITGDHVGYPRFQDLGNFSPLLNVYKIGRGFRSFFPFFLQKREKNGILAKRCSTILKINIAQIISILSTSKMHFKLILSRSGTQCYKTF